jgi:hypothetical protein
MLCTCNELEHKREFGFNKNTRKNLNFNRAESLENLDKTAKKPEKWQLQFYKRPVDFGSCSTYELREILC